jgi:hypothetical protein
VCCIYKMCETTSKNEYLPAFTVNPIIPETGSTPTPTPTPTLTPTPPPLPRTNPRLNTTSGYQIADYTSIYDKTGGYQIPTYRSIYDSDNLEMPNSCS